MLVGLDGHLDRRLRRVIGNDDGALVVGETTRTLETMRCRTTKPTWVWDLSRTKVPVVGSVRPLTVLVVGARVSVILRLLWEGLAVHLLAQLTIFN